MKNHILTAFLVAWAVLLSGCEKAVFDEPQTETKTEAEAGANVVLCVANVGQVMEGDGTRAAVDITGYSTRLNFVLYQNGEKLKALTQMQGEADFGKVSLTLAAGNYKLLVLAHSSMGNPTLASAEEIKFNNASSYSDTFYYYGDIEVTTEQQTYEVMLQRASSLLRFIIADDIPDDVARLRFFYTGGSGVLNAVTGYGGNVNSKQEKLYNIEGLSAPLALRLYTFLQGDEGALDVTVRAERKDDSVVLERKFTGITVRRNVVSEYRGSFFEHASGFALMADTAWADTLRMTY